MFDQPGWPPRSRLGAAAVVLGVFAAGLAVGFLWGGRPGRRALVSSDREIRAGHEGFTNPLLECEIAQYAPGYELRPFSNELKDLVARQEREGRAAHISVYFRDLDNGPWFGIKEDRAYLPASLLKVPILMAIIKQAERDPSLLGKELLFDPLPGEAALPRDLGIADPLEAGRTYRVEELMVRTAAASDNDAFLLLARIVERRGLHKMLNELGLDTDLADWPGRPVALSPHNYGNLFRVLYNATYLNHDNSERLLGYFARSMFHDGLELGLPPGIPVAHKFGIYKSADVGPDQAQLHDCGIVYAPRRPYFLCVMTSGRDPDVLAGVIAEISRFVYEKIER